MDLVAVKAVLAERRVTALRAIQITSQSLKCDRKNYSVLSHISACFRSVKFDKAHQNRSICSANVQRFDANFDTNFTTDK